MACCVCVGCHSSNHGASAAPDVPSDALSGNIDVRPFTARVAYANERVHDDDIDIHVFHKSVDRAKGCAGGTLGLDDTERHIWIQMPWPVPVGSDWESTDINPPKNDAGIFFNVQRGLGNTGQRALGDVRVLDVHDNGGTLFVDAATPNHTGGVHGTVRGTVRFERCPD